MNRKLTIVLLLLTVVALAGVPQASATPTIKNNFTTLYGVAGTRIDSCDTCHIPGQTPSFSTLNPYGKDLFNDSAYATNVTQSMINVEPKDSDNDGFTNINEIHNLTFPGSASDFPPVITSSSPTSPVADVVGASRTFTVTVNQPLNVIWLINGSQVQNTMTTGANNQSTYTNTSAALGTWNISAIAQKAGDGSAMQTWIWNVGVPPKPAGTFNISGFKINASSGNGIPGWNITITNTTMQKSMLTSADGSYKFTDLVNGTYNVSEEMRPAEFTPVGATFHLETIAGQDIMNVNFTNAPITLIVNGTIAGKVTNASSGLAISGATVTANGITATTNANGNYSINIAAGTYTVTANATGYLSNTTTGVVVTPGNITTKNFALIPAPKPRTFNISGFKINDTNGNGVWNPGEMGIENWNIMLLNDTGVQLANTSTNAQGFYQFMNIFPGKYNIAEEVKPGFTPTNATSIPVTVENMDVMNVNFTNTPVAVKNGSISGMKFNDSDGNGIRESNEAGLPNWTIVLKNSTGATVAIATTDANGNYSFTNLSAGNYTVGEVLKSDWKQTAPPTGTYTVIITSAGENVTGRDFGNMQIVVVVPTFNISGFKLNGATDSGIQGWNITIKNSTMQTTTMTNMNGFYEFTGLVNGTYNVSEEMKPGFIPVGATFKVITIENMDVTNVNFTNQPIVQTFTISGFKINDTNGNGVWDPGETGIENWNIMLLNDTGVQLANTSTNAQGFYQFMNIFPGKYNIAEEVKSGFTPTNATSIPVTVENMDVTNVNFTNMQVVPPTLGSISGFKINAANGMGLQGWTIKLIGIVGKGTETRVIRRDATTNDDGSYTFDELPAGRYIIREELQRGFVPVGSPVKNIVLELGENSMNNNFTNRPIQSLVGIEEHKDAKGDKDAEDDGDTE